MRKESHVHRLIRQRRSVRRYLEKPVPREDIVVCLDAARLASSAENVQPWRFIVMDEPEVIKEFSRKCFRGLYSHTRWAANAPVLILILSRPDILANRIGKQIQSVAYHLIDIGVAGQQLVLQAADLGLGTCWIGWFNMRRARKFFGIPRKYKVVSMLALGHPQPPLPRERKKRPLEEIAWFNSFKGK